MKRLRQGVMYELEWKVIRRLASGQQALPRRDQEVAERLEDRGMIKACTTGRGDRAWDLTDRGIQALLDADGPLTDEERNEWLSWPKTRIGKNGAPQKLLRFGWRIFNVPRARVMMVRWRRYGIREGW